MTKRYTIPELAQMRESEDHVEFKNERLRYYIRFLRNNVIIRKEGKKNKGIWVVLK